MLRSYGDETAPCYVFDASTEHWKRGPVRYGALGTVRPAWHSGHGGPQLVERNAGQSSPPLPGETAPSPVWLFCPHPSADAKGSTTPPVPDVEAIIQLLCSNPKAGAQQFVAAIKAGGEQAQVLASGTGHAAHRPCACAVLLRHLRVPGAADNFSPLRTAAPPARWPSSRC